MKTNFNSQICTTPKQSQKLIDLGLHPDTADMTLCYTVRMGDPNPIQHIPMPIQYKKCDLDLPAWSLNRLIEIYDKTCIFWPKSGDNPYEAMISRIADKIKRKSLNKAYLKE